MTETSLRNVLVLLGALLVLVPFQVAEAAMCGTGPWNTDEGYWCSNYCRSTPPATSCSAWCCGWVDEDIWGQMTCGASPYPCVWDVCGDHVCNPPVGESSTTCPQDCGYLPDGGGPTHNSCVVDVVGSVLDATQHSPGNYYSGLSLDPSHNEIVCGNVYLPPFDWDCLIAGIMSGASKCHIQGIARIRNTPYLVFVGNTAGEGGVFNDCDDSAQDRLESMGLLGSHMFLAWDTNYVTSQPRLWPPDSGNWGAVVVNRLDFGGVHPGGIQSSGDYVAVGVDNPNGTANIYIYRVYDIMAPEPVYSFSVPTQAQSVGLSLDHDGDYILTVGSESSKRIDFYRSSSGTISGPYVRFNTWTLGGDGIDTIYQPNWEHIDYQSINLVRECGTRRMYLVATGRENVGFDGGEFSGDDYVHVYIVEYNSDPVHLVARFRRHFYLENGNWMAGGGTYITDDGKLHFYGIEHGFSATSTYVYIRGDELW